MSRVERLSQWLQVLQDPGARVCYKRLSANDTGATRSHQAGPYLPIRIAFEIAPELQRPVLNPRRELQFRLASHDQLSRPHLIYYNNHIVAGGSRNECRITGFGGRASALQDTDNTGAILLILFAETGPQADAWLATSLEEEELIESQMGPVLPGIVGFRRPDSAGQPTLIEVARGSGRCDAHIDTVPWTWRTAFPSPSELAGEAARRFPLAGRDPDWVLMARHDCEYALFRMVEEAIMLPQVESGFSSVATFLAVAQSVLQRRKARAGRSLELQLGRLFSESDLQFSAQCITEDGHKPDFVFPSIERYRAAQIGAADLTILAAKSTLRDRWRQVLTEADKVPTKHLFTLDEGVSEAQFRAIRAAGIVLVVPNCRTRNYPGTIRRELMSLGGFLAEVRRRAGVDR